MHNWPHFSYPEFALGFQYPQSTPHGHILEKEERREEGVIRVHFTSKDSRELYFEISKYNDLSPQAEYQRHKENLEARLEQFVVSELREIRWMSQPAYEYSLKWPRGTRTVTLIEADGATYRILYDPSSPLNIQVLSTLRWTY
jgi:hypothetical protein